MRELAQAIGGLGVFGEVEPECPYLFAVAAADAEHVGVVGHAERVVDVGRRVARHRRQSLVTRRAKTKRRWTGLVRKSYPLVSSAASTYDRAVRHHFRSEERGLLVRKSSAVIPSRRRRSRGLVRLDRCGA